MGLGSQMVAVAVGWQVFEIHHSALRPRPDRARRVRAAAAARAPGRAISPTASRAGSSSPASPALDDRGRRAACSSSALTGAARALAVPRARGRASGRERDRHARRRGRCRPMLVPFEPDRERDGAALDRVPGRRCRRARDRRPALRAPPELVYGVGGRAAHVRPRLHPRSSASRARERRASRGAGPRQPARRHPLHPPDAGPARRDLARPLRRAVRRRVALLPRLRAVDPPHGPGRPRPAAQRARRRRAARRRACSRAARSAATPARRCSLVVARVRREHDRLRPLAARCRSRSPRWR